MVSSLYHCHDEKTSDINRKVADDSQGKTGDKDCRVGGWSAAHPCCVVALPGVYAASAAMGHRPRNRRHRGGVGHEGESRPLPAAFPTETQGGWRGNRRAHRHHAAARHPTTRHRLRTTDTRRGEGRQPAAEGTTHQQPRHDRGRGHRRTHRATLCRQHPVPDRRRNAHNTTTLPRPLAPPPQPGRLSGRRHRGRRSTITPATHQYQRHPPCRRGHRPRPPTLGRQHEGQHTFRHGIACMPPRPRGW